MQFYFGLDIVWCPEPNIFKVNMATAKSWFNLPNFRDRTEVLNFSLWSPSLFVDFQGTECDQAPYFGIWASSSVVGILPHSMDLHSLKIGSANTLDIPHELAVCFDAWPSSYFVTNILNGKITNQTKNYLPTILDTVVFEGTVNNKGSFPSSKKEKFSDFLFCCILKTSDSLFFIIYLLISFFLPLSSIPQSFLNLKHVCPKYDCMARHLVLTCVFIFFVLSFVFQLAEISSAFCVI